jgi:enoyl-[acyl-carrier protein] reductase I
MGVGAVGEPPGIGAPPRAGKEDRS